MMRKTILLSLLASSLASFAQAIHTVEKGDTAYNLSKKYGMSLDELYRLNPNIKDGGLSLGAQLKVKNGVTTNVNSTSKHLGKIILKPKQTLYSITKQYHISTEELKKLNPNLESLTKIGDEIVLPADAIKKYGDPETTIVQQATTTINSGSTAKSQQTIGNITSYVVKEKDNYYRIGKTFNITKDQLFALNPGLEAKGLQPGETIQISGNTVEPQKTSEPQKENSSTQENDFNTETVKESAPIQAESANQSLISEDYVTYTVQAGDTVFGILNKFGISLDQLLSLNPDLSKGLKPGMVLKIKKLDAAFVKKNSNALNVVVLLPFGFNTNDTKYRSLSQDFLFGAKLAIERNAKRGLAMDINFIDAGNEKSFKKSLTQINQDNTDLIIGPFFKSNIIEVLDFVSKDKIPVVSPFANSEDLYGYSNLIIVGTSDQVFADKITQEVKAVYSNQKIYIVAEDTTGISSYLKNTLSKQLKNTNINIVKSASDISQDQNMMTGQPAPVIGILASDNENLGNDFAAKMLELNKATSGNKAFSMYYSPVFEKKSDELTQLNLVYLMDRKINTEGSFEKEILADFKAKYCKSPSKYSIIGFDVVNDILSRENKKGEVLKNMTKTQTQLATKFEYERAQNNGAYVNKGFRVVRLIP